MPPLSADANELIREILHDPAIPVASLAALPEAPRISALREAFDHLNTIRAGATAVQSGDGTAFLDELAAIDHDLADALRWHPTLVALIESLPPGAGRNAALGDVHRGELLTWAALEGEWQWIDGVSDEAEPIRRASFTLRLERYPGLYDSILVWEPVSASLVVIPTHRSGLTWQPAPSDASWLAQGSAVAFHINELIASPGHPHQSPAWREYPTWLGESET